MGRGGVGVGGWHFILKSLPQIKWHLSGKREGSEGSEPSPRKSIPGRGNRKCSYLNRLEAYTCPVLADGFDQISTKNRKILVFWEVSKKFLKIIACLVFSFLWIIQAVQVIKYSNSRDLHKVKYENSPSCPSLEEKSMFCIFRLCFFFFAS